MFVSLQNFQISKNKIEKVACSNTLTKVTHSRSLAFYSPDYSFYLLIRIGQKNHITYMKKLLLLHMSEYLHIFQYQEKQLGDLLIQISNRRVVGQYVIRHLFFDVQR